MTPQEIKDARKALGLSVADFGRLLETDAQSVRRWEMSGDRSTARAPPPRVGRLIRAYLDGHRPADWPETQKSPAPA